MHDLKVGEKVRDNTIDFEVGVVHEAHPNTVCVKYGNFIMIYLDEEIKLIERVEVANVN